jgi:hypothetical protein
MYFLLTPLWLVLLVFAPFVLGLLAGLNSMKRKITMHLLKKLSIEEFERLMSK